MKTMFQRLHQLAILAGLLLLPGCSGCGNDPDVEIRITKFIFTNNTSTSANVTAALGELGAYQNDALQPSQTDEVSKEFQAPSEYPRTCGSMSGTVTVGGLTVNLPKMPLVMGSTYTITITESPTHLIVTVGESGVPDMTRSNQVAKVTS